MKIAYGLATAGLLLTVVLTLPGPARLGRGLYDGVSPLPPYRWVHPPRDLARDNRPPEGELASVDLQPSGKSPGSVTTADGQCTIIFNDGSVAAGSAGRTLTVTLTPLDPAALGAPPAGTRFDGNACRIGAAYGKTGTAPDVRRPVTVVLRYATGGTQLVRAAQTDRPLAPRQTGPAWHPITSVRYAGHIHLLVADVPGLGTFAPVAPATTPYVQGTPWTRYAASVALILLVALALRLLPRRHRPRRGTG